LPHHRTVARCSAESRHSGGRGARDPAAGHHLSAMAAPTGPRARGRAREMSVVTVDDIALRFGERTLFEDLSFALERGELLAVLGPNGTGKTSLIRILLGLLQPSAGTVVIEGCPPRER